MRTPHDTALHMQKTYGKDAPIHATYNIMLYDKGSKGHTFWVDVVQCMRDLTSHTAVAAPLSNKGDTNA